jgi:hypothetical protein
MAVLVKTIYGLAYASVKTRRGLAVASIKGINGLDASGGSSPTVPSDITGLLSDWDVHALGLSNNDPISSLTDSISSNHAVNTGSARPTYKTGVINSKAVAEFVPANSQYLLMGSGILGNSDWTIASVYKARTSGVFFFPITATDNQNYGAANYTDGETYIAGRGDLRSFTGVNHAAFVICVSTCSAGGGLAMWWNGVSKTLSSSYGSFTCPALQAIGSRNNSGQYGDGQLARVLVWDNSISTPNRQWLEDYLGSPSTGYDITITH